MCSWKNQTDWPTQRLYSFKNASPTRRTLYANEYEGAQESTTPSSQMDMGLNDNNEMKTRRRQNATHLLSWRSARVQRATRLENLGCATNGRNLDALRAVSISNQFRFPQQGWQDVTFHRQEGSLSLLNTQLTQPQVRNQALLRDSCVLCRP